MKINLHLLRIFYTVTECNSFSRAAEALFISQPAVSKGVRELEHQLGLPLIERGESEKKRTRGIRLTECGQAICQHARGIFALERSAVEDIEARINLKRGRLVIGASTTVAGYNLPPYIAKFSQHHPLVDIRVMVGNTRHISQSLIDCDVDIALVEGDVNDQRIIVRQWQHDLLSIVAPNNSPITQQRNVKQSDLSEQVWIMREQGSGTREVTEKKLRASGIIPKNTIEIGSNEGIARTVASGAGIAILPTIMVKDLLDLKRVSTIRTSNKSSYTRTLFYLHIDQRPQSPIVQRFVECLFQAD